MKITSKHLILKSTEYRGANSEFVKNNDPRKAARVTRTDRGIKKLFLIRAADVFSDFIVSQNFTGLNTIFLIPTGKKLKFIKKQI